MATESGSGSWCTTGLSIAGLGARRAGAQHQPDYEPHGYRAEVRLHSCSPISISLQRDLFSHGLGPKILHSNGKGSNKPGEETTERGKLLTEKNRSQRQRGVNNERTFYRITLHLKSPHESI